MLYFVRFSKKACELILLIKYLLYKFCWKSESPWYECYSS